MKVITPSPQSYALDDLFNFDRWMCSNCGLILDYRFEIGEAGWPRFEPDLHVPDYDIDEEGNEYQVVVERKEFCPRCDISFDDSPPTLVTVREIRKLSDFFREGEGEGVTLDFKENFTSDHIRNTIAAFAMTQGGKVILGINNKGIPVGYKGEEKVETTEGKDQLQKRIRGLLANIEPKVQIRVHFVDNEAGLHFTVIIVPKGSAPLYSINGKYYIRDVDQTRGATTDEILQITKHWHTRKK